MRRLAIVPMVVVLLLLVDQVLFGFGWFWRLPITFGSELDSMTWEQVYRAARRLETYDGGARTSIVVGDSAVVFGVDADVLNDRLQAEGLASPSLVLGINGASASDSSLVAWEARRTDPWLIVLGLGSRDFRNPDDAVTPVLRTFYDASADLPFARDLGLAGQGDAYVRRFWRLYRYRSFGWAIVQAKVDEIRTGIAIAPVSMSDSPLLENDDLFDFRRISPNAVALWAHWRDTRSFEDYKAWLRAKSRGLLHVYWQNAQRSYAPADNPHLRSLAATIRVLRTRGVRTVLVNTPENPIFRAPEAREYFDGTLSDQYAAVLAGLAADEGARFVDLRQLLDPVEFEDLLHANCVGKRKISVRLAEIIAEEWKAANGAGDLARREGEMS